MSEFFCDSLPHMDTDGSCALNDQQLSADQLQSEEASVMEHEETEVPKLLSEIIKPPPTPPPEPEMNAAMLANLSALPNQLAFIEEIKSKTNQSLETSGENTGSSVAASSEPEDARSAPPPPPVVVDLKTKPPTLNTPAAVVAGKYQPEQTTQAAESLRIRTPLVAAAAAAAAAAAVAASGGFPIEHRQQNHQRPSANGSINGEMAVLGEVTTDQQSKGCAADPESPVKRSPTKDSDSQDGSK